MSERRNRAVSSKKEKSRSENVSESEKTEKKEKKTKEKKTKEKKQKAAKKAFSLERLFSSDRFMLALSFIISFFIWTVMSVNNGETVNYPVTDIPVSMELSEDAVADNLAVISVDGVPIDDFKTTVRVKGNSVTVGSLKPSDIQVYGSNLGNIVTSGSYSVSLMARQLGVKNNYDIVSVNPSDVKIVVDRNITSEFTIEAVSNATSPVGYYMGALSLSQQSVTVTGPEQITSKIAKVTVNVDVDHEIEETMTLTNLPVILLDSDGNEISDSSLSVTPPVVDATIPVLLKKTVPVTLDIVNAPLGFDSSSLITLEPSEIEIAAYANTLDSVDSISAGTLDLSDVAYKMDPIEYRLTMPDGVRNLSNVESAEASFNFDLYVTKSFVIDDFEFKNLADGLTAKSTSNAKVIVRILGERDEVAPLTTSDVSAWVDLSDMKVGTAIVPVNISVDTPLTKSWVYGSYSLTVTVEDENSTSRSSSSQTDTG